MIFGYGRVSTRDQNLYLQEDALKAAGCDEIFMEKITGSKRNRPELDRMLSKLRSGDRVVVWKLVRWGRSLTDLIYLINLLHDRKVQFQCLTLSMDTTTPEGKLVYNLFGALGEFERETIVENTNAGLASARARGRIGGRPRGLSPKAKERAKVSALLYKDKNPVDKILDMVGIKSKATLYNYLRHEGIKIGAEEQTNALQAETNNMADVPTIDEQVLTYLQSQLTKGISGPKIDKNEMTLATRLCSAFSFGRHLNQFDPDEVAEACRRLVADGLVEQRDDQGIPSFIPVEFL